MKKFQEYKGDIKNCSHCGAPLSGIKTKVIHVGNGVKKGDKHAKSEPLAFCDELCKMQSEQNFFVYQTEPMIYIGA